MVCRTADPEWKAVWSCSLHHLVTRPASCKEKCMAPYRWNVPSLETMTRIYGFNIRDAFSFITGTESCCFTMGGTLGTKAFWEYLLPKSEKPKPLIGSFCRSHHRKTCPVSSGFLFTLFTSSHISSSCCFQGSQVRGKNTNVMEPH